MGLASNIEWTDHTWNPWQGCTKVSPACTNCYMYRDKKRYGDDPTQVVRSATGTFNLPLKKNRAGEYAIPDGSKVFPCSWSDWFHKDADAWRPEAWQIIKQRPGVIFQIVTKRTERIAECLPDDWGDGYPNVWPIATVENQMYADIRIPQLLEIPAVVRGLSCEPLLGPIDLNRSLGGTRWIGGQRGCRGTHIGIGSQDCPREPHHHHDDRCRPGLNWVIAGGESGPDSRPTHPDWIRSLRDQCQAASVPFFFKQWGDWCPPHAFTSGPRTADEQVIDMEGRNVFGLPGLQDETCARVFRVGKKHAGRLLDGVEWSQFPSLAKPQSR